MNDQNSAKIYYCFQNQKQKSLVRVTFVGDYYEKV